MQKMNRKLGNLFLSIILMVSFMTPMTVFANEVLPDIQGNPENPKLTIHKYAHEKGQEQNAGTGLPDQEVVGTPLSGVEFTITQVESYHPNTNEWTAVSEEPKTYTTNSDGLIEIDNISLGRYKLQETDGPTDVILNDQEYFIDIPMTNESGTVLNYNVHVYPKNIVIRGDVEFIKQDDAGNTLEGVKFALYNSDGSPVVHQGENVILETNAKGVISLVGLKQGKYYLQEIETNNGFAINNEKIEFEILAGTQNEVSIKTSDGFVYDDGKIVNYKTPDLKKDVEGDIQYTIDRDKEYVYNITINTPLDIDKYKVLGVSDTLDDRLTFVDNGSIEDGWEVSGTSKDNIEFKQDGQTLSWYVKEFYKLTPGEDIVITFTSKIKPDAELKPGEEGIPNKAELDFDNDRGEESDQEDPPTTPPVIVDPNDGGLKVIKVDAANNNLHLAGAEFKLTTDKEGKDVVKAEDTVITVNGESHNGLLEDLTTGEYGTFTIDGLPSGTYYLHETKAPEYTINGETKSYILLEKPVKVKFKANKEKNHEVMIENIRPDDPDEEEPSDPVKPGDPGKPGDPDKPGINIPTTGGLGTTLYTIIGLMFIGLALILYLRRRNEKQNA